MSAYFLVFVRCVQNTKKSAKKMSISDEKLSIYHAAPYCTIFNSCIQNSQPLQLYEISILTGLWIQNVCNETVLASATSNCAWYLLSFSSNYSRIMVNSNGSKSEKSLDYRNAIVSSWCEFHKCNLVIADNFNEMTLNALNFQCKESL